MSFADGNSGYFVDKNIHLTYKEKPDMQSLCQGDILEITEEISMILKDVHPFFLNE